MPIFKKIWRIFVFARSVGKKTVDQVVDIIKFRLQTCGLGLKIGFNIGDFDLFSPLSEVQVFVHVLKGFNNFDTEVQNMIIFTQICVRSIINWCN